MLRNHLAAVLITGGTDFFSESPSLGRFDPHSEFWDHSVLLQWRYPMPRKDTPRLSIPDPNYFLFELNQQWSILTYVKEVIELDQQWSLGLHINFEALSDALPLSDATPTFKLIISPSILEVFPLADTASATKLVPFTLPNDTLPLVDTLSMVLTIVFEVIEDRLGLFETAALSPEFAGWAVNTDTGATSRYSWAQGLNSFVEHDGRFYAAAADGIYELTGDDDEGVQIEALGVVGQTDMGVAGEKRVRAAYVGARTGGGMFVRVVLDDNEVFEYEVEEYEIAEMQARRAVLGRGLRGVYWQFAFGNVDGSDIEVKTLRVTPIQFQRRMR